MGLHDLLGNTLSSLSEDKMLLSWSVFPEKDGHISVKIRFGPTDDSVNRDTEAHFKRKPLRQVQRDRERSRAWRAQSVTNKQTSINKKQQQQSIPRSEEKSTSPGHVSAETFGAQTRSRVKTTTKMNTPEIARYDPTPTDDDEIDRIAQQLCMDTVDTVANTDNVRSQNECKSPGVDVLLTPCDHQNGSPRPEKQYPVMCDSLPLEDCSGDNNVVADLSADAVGDMHDDDDDDDDHSTSSAHEFPTQPTFCLRCWWYDGLNTGSCPDHG